MTGFQKADGRHVADIKMYTLSTCGWCRKTKDFLNEHGIEYSYVDVDLLPEAERERVSKEQQKYNPDGSFPTLVVNGSQTIVGYDQKALDALIGV